MPENYFGLGSPLHPDAASIKKAPRRPKKGKKHSRKNTKHTSAKLIVQKGVPTRS